MDLTTIALGVVAGLALFLRGAPNLANGKRPPLRNCGIGP